MTDSILIGSEPVLKVQSFFWRPDRPSSVGWKGYFHVLYREVGAQHRFITTTQGNGYQWSESLWQSEYFGDYWLLTKITQTGPRLGFFDGRRLSPDAQREFESELKFRQLFFRPDSYSLLSPVDKARPLFTSETFRSVERKPLSEEELQERKRLWDAGQLSYHSRLPDVQHENVLENMSWLTYHMPLRKQFC